MSMRKIGGVSLLWVLFCLLFLSLSPIAALGQVASQRTCTVRQFWSLTNHGPNQLTKVELWIALIQDLPPYQTVLSRTTSPPTLSEVTDRNGNRYAKFTWRNVRPGQRIEVELEYEVEVNELRFDLSSCKSTTIPEEVRQFLSPERYIESNAPQIKNLAQALVKECSSPCEVLRTIYDYVTENIEYTGYIPETRGALRTLEDGGGDCTEFACLLVALCQAAGLPARFVEGIADVPGDEKHNWAEVYLGGVGWVPVDPTWGRFPSDRERYFAAMPSDHIILTRGINPCLPTMHHCEGRLRYWYYEYSWEGKEPRISVSEDWDWIVVPLQTIFVDDFRNPTSGWPIESNSEHSFAYEDGEYRLEVKQKDRTTWVWAPPLSPADFSVSVDARTSYGVDPERAYGIIWGDGDEVQYLLFFDSTGHFKLGKKRNGEWQPDPLPWRSHPAVHRGNGTTHIEVTVIGSQVRIMVNDVSLAEVEVPNLGPVRVGLFVCTFTRSWSQVSFDNFRIEPLELE